MLDCLQAAGLISGMTKISCIKYCTTQRAGWNSITNIPVYKAFLALLETEFFVPCSLSCAPESPQVCKKTVLACPCDHGIPMGTGEDNT